MANKKDSRGRFISASSVKNEIPESVRQQYAQRGRTNSLTIPSKATLPAILSRIQRAWSDLNNTNNELDAVINFLKVEPNQDSGEISKAITGQDINQGILQAIYEQLDWLEDQIAINSAKSHHIRDIIGAKEVNETP